MKGYAQVFRRSWGKDVKFSSLTYMKISNMAYIYSITPPCVIISALAPNMPHYYFGARCGRPFDYRWSTIRVVARLSNCLNLLAFRSIPLMLYRSDLLIKTVKIENVRRAACCMLINWYPGHMNKAAQAR